MTTTTGHVPVGDLAADHQVVAMHLQGHGGANDTGRPLRSGGVNGDVEGRPASRLVVLPGTTHVGGCAPAWCRRS